jgi:beta-phosphoglucomutase-like phosphatase (HAD superfamily)
MDAVILDVDGTLIDSVDAHARAWQEALADFGYHVRYEDVRAQIGKGGDQLMPVFVPADDLPRVGEDLARHRGDLFKRRYLLGLQPFAAVRDLVERILGSGRRIALASSARADEVETYKRIARIEDLIAEETTADDVERSKPHPDVFEAALERLGGMSPGQAIAIGDTPYDAEGAAKAGLATIGMLCGGFPEADLLGAGCVAIYRDPADLLERFDESPIVRPTTRPAAPRPDRPASPAPPPGGRRRASRAGARRSRQTSR